MRAGEKRCVPGKGQENGMIGEMNIHVEIEIGDAKIHLSASHDPMLLNWLLGFDLLELKKKMGSRSQYLNPLLESDLKAR